MYKLAIKVSPVHETELTYLKDTDFISMHRLPPHGTALFKAIKNLQENGSLGEIDEFLIYGNTAYIEGLINKDSQFNTYSFASAPIYIENKKYERGGAC